MRDQLSIRDANPDDIGTIVEFNAAIARETEDLELDRERLLAGVTAIVNDSGKGRYFMATANGKVVGQTMVTFEWSDWRNGDFWWIQSVYVTPEARSMGVFSSLYDHIVKTARRHDVRGLRLYVDSHNLRALKVYEKLGMHESQYRMMEVDFVLQRKGVRHVEQG